eukprot:g43544.t1
MLVLHLHGVLVRFVLSGDLGGAWSMLRTLAWSGDGDGDVACSQMKKRRRRLERRKSERKDKAGELGDGPHEDSRSLNGSRSSRDSTSTSRDRTQDSYGSSSLRWSRQADMSDEDDPPLPRYPSPPPPSGDLGGSSMDDAIEISD